MFVANGYIQKYEVEYLETFAPIAKINSVKIILLLTEY